VLQHFSIRFLIAVVGGAALGLLVGAVGRYGFGADWNIFAAASWGIMAAAVGLSFSYAMGSERWTGARWATRKREPERD
jgi:uncharacterized membrane protein